MNPNTLIMFAHYGLIIVSVLALTLGDRWFFLDWFAHATTQIWFLIIVTTIFSLTQKRWAIGVIGLLYIIIVAWTLIFPITFSSQSVPAADIFFMNTLYSNKDNQVIVDEINKNQPQVVALVEPHEDLVAILSENYGEPDALYHQTGLSVALFTDTTATPRAEVRFGAITKYPYIVAEFPDYTLIVIHPMPPMDQERNTKIKQHLSLIRDEANLLARNGSQVIITGDFNMTRYSRTFRRNFGDWYQSQRPTWWNSFILALPIDHVLSNQEIKVQRAPRLSSDHSGLYITIPEQENDQ